jgi:hypothetical protein
MNSRTLEIVLKLQDDASQQIKEFEKRTSSLKENLMTTAKVSGAAFAGLVGIIGTSVKAYADSEKQLARVDQTIENTTALIGGDFKFLSGEARKFGAELQALGGIGDEAGAEGFAKMLLTTGGDIAEAQKLATLAADLSISKQIDYATAVKTVSMVQAGNTRVLREYGIVLDENATKEQATAALIETVGGQYKKYGNTLAGQTDILKQSFGDLQEVIGQAFMPIFVGLVKTIQPYLMATGQWISENQTLVKWIGIVAVTVSGLVFALSSLGLALLVIKPALIAIGAAFALLMSPIGIIIGLLVLIGATIAYLALNWEYHWETIKWAFQGFVDFIGVAWEFVKQLFIDAMNFIVGFVVHSLEMLGIDWKAWFKTIEAVINVFVEFWKGAWDIIYNILVATWNGIKSFIPSAVNAVMKYLDPLIQKFERIISLAGDLGVKIGGTTKKIAGNISAGVSAAIDIGRSVTGVNDAIISPRGDIITTHPDDYLIATKNPQSLGGGGITINVETVIGSDEYVDKLGRVIINSLQMQQQM